MLPARPAASPEAREAERKVGKSFFAANVFSLGNCHNCLWVRLKGC